MPCKEVRAHPHQTQHHVPSCFTPAADARRRTFRGAALIFVIAALVFLARTLPAVGAQFLVSSEDCLACHSDRELAKPGPAGTSVTLFVDQTRFQASVHGFLECVHCHADATEIPHADRLKKVHCQSCHEVAVSGAHALDRKKGLACATCHGSHEIQPPQESETAICMACHPAVVREYDDSVHGRALARGDRDVAQCHSCHGSAHDLKKVRDPGSPAYPLNLPRTCGTCHGDPELAKRHGISVGDVYQLYMDSIHGRALARSGLLVAANCSSCHGFHGIRSKEDPASKVHRANVPSTCGACHAGLLKDYLESVHGTAVRAGIEAAPVCIDCHTAHQIARVETVEWQLGIIQECGTCHRESLRTYRDTFHGHVSGLGFTRVARCSDCHGSHRILPASDPGSSIAPSNRVATCQQCHPRATESFVQFMPHADPKDKNRNPGLYYAALFMNALMIGTFSFFGLHTLLWLGRSLIEMRRARPRRVGSPVEPGQEGGETPDRENEQARDDAHNVADPRRESGDAQEEPRDV